MENSRIVVFRFFAEPTDVNFGGKVHGGAVMKWLDQTAFACASSWSGTYCVTVFVGGIHFVRPIYIGNIVQITAKLIYTGTSSMHIALEVKSKSPKEHEYVVNTHCTMVFVAVDDKGNKVKVPKWTPMTEEDKEAEKLAVQMKGLFAKFEDNTKKLMTP